MLGCGTVSFASTPHRNAVDNFELRHVKEGLRGKHLVAQSEDSLYVISASSAPRRLSFEPFTDEAHRTQSLRGDKTKTLLILLRP
jgi:hypothetical protein